MNAKEFKADIKKPIVIEYDVAYKYTEAQSMALNLIDENPVSYLKWERGTGKTFIGVDAMIRRCIKNPGYKCLMLTASSNYRTSFEYARDWITNNSGLFDERTTIYCENTPQMYSQGIRFSNGSSIFFFRAPDNISSLQGMEIHMLFVDDWEMLSPVRREVVSQLTKNMDIPLLPMGNVTEHRLLVCMSDKPVV